MPTNIHDLSELLFDLFLGFILGYILFLLKILK